jgi:ABC-type lipoprotein release transport system permease subunit
LSRVRRKSQKHLNFLQYAAKGVFTYKTRTIAIVCSLLVAVMILGAMTFLSEGLSREAGISASFAPDITVQNMAEGRPAGTQIADAQLISQMPGVERVVPREWGYVAYNGKIYTILGIEPANMPIPKEINFVMDSGHFLLPNETYRAIVGKSVADSFGLKVGDVMVLQTESRLGNFSFLISGIFKTSVNILTSDLIMVNINDAHTFFGGYVGTSTDLCVYVKNPAETAQIAAQIAAYNPMMRVLTRDAIKEATLSTYGGRSGYVSIAWYILLISVILVAWNQATAAGTEMKKEVGILKALGFSTSNILEIRFLETLILGFVAATLGVFLAIFYDVYLGAPVLRDFMLGWSATYPGFALPININPSTVLILYAAAIFPLFIGSLIPAWRSAVTEPDVAMRGS